MNQKKIVIAHFDDVLLYPPVINLIENLLCHKHKVYLVSISVHKLSERILRHSNFRYEDIKVTRKNNVFGKALRRMQIRKQGKMAVKKYMNNADILWTTTDFTLMNLGKVVFNYKHVMQLMELDKYFPYSKYIPWIRFPIEIYAKKAWKVVVPEENRAYIQKIYWELEKVPIVLPNKPYTLSLDSPSKDMEESLEIIKNEKRKIILYLGIINADRDFEAIAKALNKIGKDYCLYIIGKKWNDDDKEFDKWISSQNNIKYLGYFPAPKHLLFLQYAYIGLLPYKPTNQSKFVSELNALYCAPNKIFEYSGFGIPMLGSDVLGLKNPFEKFNIGVCYLENEKSIITAIKEIETHYEEMSRNCHKYYDSVNLDKIVENIIN